MKRLKTLLLAIVLFVGGTSLSSAQSKIAHINLGEVITAMPEYKTAQAEIEKLNNTYNTEIQASLKELQDKVKQYTAEGPTQTDEENKKRQAEVQGMEQSLAVYQQQAQQDIQKQELDKIKPIREKAQAAVKKVATALGYDYVLDLTTLVVATGKDITADVKKELGI
ncbi:MAG: OmpH family outer membrane protein [Winogradskyella sp.]|uniref:OmpH family outer membrane protein n=1 Tax=Winogradskyella sp. TaxID=1883156 RepID=UPI000F3F9E37|nr:OmpH family outer membrane protein [Winogradskyella sp.]RNC84287.1 MAG: OmpH family outer membrane protein [Winogradskyella sp.]